MFKIIFPLRTNQHYWSIHYQYVLNIFKYLKCDILFEERDAFVVTINEQNFLFDYNDHYRPADVGIRIFKFHSRQPTSKQVIPFTPVSFYDWDFFRTLQKEINYTGTSDLISCRQRPYGNAKLRRIAVQNMLKESFGDRCLFDIIRNDKYLQEINKIFIAVFVPGFCNTMIDRGSLEYLALGCPIITTRIPEYFPFDEQLKPNEHYIECQEDYGDLVELINLCHNNINRNDLAEMGKRAKLFFDDNSTPERLGKWISINL